MFEFLHCIKPLMFLKFFMNLLYWLEFCDQLPKYCHNFFYTKWNPEHCLQISGDGFKYYLFFFKLRFEPIKIRYLVIHFSKFGRFCPLQNNLH